MTSDRIEHRRASDGERLGWMRPQGEGFVAVDLLGRELTGEVDWYDAEHSLDDLGLAYLAEPYELLTEGRWIRVRIKEVRPDRLVVTTENWGAIDIPVTAYDLPIPVDVGRLRPWTPG